MNRNLINYSWHPIRGQCPASLGVQNAAQEDFFFLTLPKYWGGLYKLREAWNTAARPTIHKKNADPTKDLTDSIRKPAWVTGNAVGPTHWPTDTTSTPCASPTHHHMAIPMGSKFKPWQMDNEHSAGATVLDWKKVTILSTSEHCTKEGTQEALSTSPDLCDQEKAHNLKFKNSSLPHPHEEQEMWKEDIHKKVLRKHHNPWLDWLVKVFLSTN